jgi:hypothetical protein
MRRPLVLSLAAAAVISGGLFAVPRQAAADVVMPTEKPRIEAKRCTMAKGRITNMTDTMRAVSERRATVYANMREKAVARVAVLKQKGYDTKKLEADLKTVNNQVEEYRAKATSLYAALAKAQDVACSDSEGDFKSALADARSQLKEVREAAQTIHKTFRTSVIPDIKAAAEWARKN